MITQTGAEESPRMRPRSARSLMLSCGIAPVVTVVAGVEAVFAVPAADAVEVFSAAGPGREQAATTAAAMMKRTSGVGIGVAFGRASRVMLRRKLCVARASHKLLHDNNVDVSESRAAQGISLAARDSETSTLL